MASITGTSRLSRRTRLELSTNISPPRANRKSPSASKAESETGRMVARYRAAKAVLLWSDRTARRSEKSTALRDNTYWASQGDNVSC
ncbi:MAG: hypothetical protein IPG31_01085 [Nitrosomonas sp.]|nr:hypothetical protein [Nitrosomonas sp.]